MPKVKKRNSKKISAFESGTSTLNTQSLNHSYTAILVVYWFYEWIFSSVMLTVEVNKVLKCSRAFYECFNRSSDEKCLFY